MKDLSFMGIIVLLTGAVVFLGNKVLKGNNSATNDGARDTRLFQDRGTTTTRPLQPDESWHNDI